MMFRIGQKVVCVRRVGERHKLTAWPEIEGIYTIRAVRTNVIRPAHGVALLLSEIKNPIDPAWDLEPGFYSNLFRPIVEKSTDTGMAILKEILERETVRDPVQATS